MNCDPSTCKVFMMSLLPLMRRLAPPAGTPVLAAALVCVSAAAGCGGADDRDGAERLDRDIRAAAGVTSQALSYDDILPDLEVTGPRLLPGLDRAGLPDAGPPWGLERATEARKAVFMSALTAVCTPAPPPETEAALDARDDAAATRGEDPGQLSDQDPSTRIGSGVGDPLRAAYPGRTTLNTLSDPAPFEGAVLRMVLDDCDGDRLPIPFLVGDDASRTWILQFQEEGLRLAHDHREPDGSPSEANLYGGVAHVPAGEAGGPGGPGGMGGTGGGAVDAAGTSGSGETILYFPADERTLEDRAGRVANVWALALDSERERFFYRLYLNGELRLEAAFDLTVTVAVEAPG
ncbi:MAG: hypothetical protein EA350_00785 [Gemmatimonadales bacterium]|nr:MAG: hypothetical protein EA350_00785 [Gemmatimonadales bacterium]